MKLEDMNVKQMIGALGYYNNADAALRKKYSFTEFINNLVLSKPEHENSQLVFEDGNKTVLIPHGFYYLTESEEDAVVRVIENND